MAPAYFTEADVERLIDIRVAIEVVREAFRQLAAGTAMNVPRVRAYAPGAVLHSMNAAAHYLQRVGWKQYVTTPQGAKFLVGLHAESSGELLALVEANRLGQLRTGAVTGLAVECLADPLPRELGLFGSGWQARSQLAAVAAVAPLERALVYSRRPSGRDRFAREMSEQLSLEVVAVDEPRAAVDRMPLVITATSSATPVFEGRWLGDGALVAAIGSNWLHRAEIDSITVQRARLIVCDSVECCRLEAGDFAAPLRQGLFSWDRARSLAEALAERPRPDGPGVTLFKSVGMAIEDVALASWLLDHQRR